MKRYYIHAGRRTGPRGVFKVFVPFISGAVIDLDHWDDIKMIEFEPYANHKSTLDYFEGV